VEINIESREFNGKYYTNVNAFKISLMGKSNDQQNEKIIDDLDLLF
jgi:hypothetical protein